MMITYLALAMAAGSAVFAGWLYTRVLQLESEVSCQEATSRRVMDAMRGYKTHIENLYSEIDLIASEGPQPAMPPKQLPAPAIELHNQRELNDGLPLHGHTLVVGQSGSGKTNILMSQIIRRLKAGQELHCIDVKDEIEPIFGSHVQCVPTDMAKQKFGQMLRIAEERRKLFSSVSQMRRKPIRDYGEYFKVTGEKLPIVTLICEELIVLMDEVDESELVKLLVTGRSAGVFVFALAQYIKADILSRKGSVNFNTTVFMGKYDSIGIGLLFGNLEKEEKDALKEFLGSPGKGAVMEQGQLKTQTFPRVTEDYLTPFFGAGHKEPGHDESDYYEDEPAEVAAGHSPWDREDRP